MSKKALLFIVVMVVLSACNKKLLPTSRIEKAYGLERFEFDYLQAKTKIKYEGEDRSLTSSATIRMKMDSIIWISITPVFGLEAARGMITKDTIVFLDRVNKSVYRYNFETLSRMVNFDLNFNMLQSIILGNQVFSFESKDNFSKNSKQIKIEQTRDRFEVNTLADAKLRKIQTVFVEESNSGNNLKLDFSDYKVVENQAFPYQIDAIVNSMQNGKASFTNVKITYNKVEPSKSSLSFPFSVSSKYE